MIHSSPLSQLCTWYTWDSDSKFQCPRSSVGYLNERDGAVVNKDCWVLPMPLVLISSISPRLTFLCTTSFKFVAHPSAHPIKVKRKAFGSRETCHSRELLIVLLIFLVSKIEIIEFTFTVAIIAIQSFDYFTISQENMLMYFIDDLMMVELGK